MFAEHVGRLLDQILRLQKVDCVVKLQTLQNFNHLLVIPLNTNITAIQTVQQYKQCNTTNNKNLATLTLHQCKTTSSSALQTIQHKKQCNNKGSTIQQIQQHYQHYNTATLQIVVIQTVQQYKCTRPPTVFFDHLNTTQKLLITMQYYERASVSIE